MTSRWAATVDWEWKNRHTDHERLVATTSERRASIWWDDRDGGGYVLSTYILDDGRGIWDIVEEQPAESLESAQATAEKFLGNRLTS